MVKYFKEVPVTRSFYTRFKMWVCGLKDLVLYPSRWIDFNYVKYGK